MMGLRVRPRVLSQVEPAVLVPPPGVGAPLCARRAPSACATRIMFIVQLLFGGEKR